MANSNPKEQTPTPKKLTPSPKEPTTAPGSSAGPSACPCAGSSAGPSAGSSAGPSADTSADISASSSADQKCPKIKNPKTLQSRLERMKEKNDDCLKIAKRLDAKIREMQGKDTMHDFQNEAIYHVIRSDNFSEQVVHARSFIPNVSAIKHHLDYEQLRIWVVELEACLNEMRSI